MTKVLCILAIVATAASLLVIAISHSEKYPCADPSMPGAVTIAPDIQIIKNGGEATVLIRNEGFSPSAGRSPWIIQRIGNVSGRTIIEMGTQGASEFYVISPDGSMQRSSTLIAAKAQAGIVRTDVYMMPPDMWIKKYIN